MRLDLEPPSEEQLKKHIEKLRESWSGTKVWVQLDDGDWAPTRFIRVDGEKVIVQDTLWVAAKDAEYEPWAVQQFNPEDRVRIRREKRDAGKDERSGKRRRQRRAGAVRRHGRA